MSGMCEHPVRVSVDVCEITFCYDFFGGFNLWVKTNMHSEQDAEVEIDTAIFFLKFKYFFKKLTLNLLNKWNNKFQIFNSFFQQPKLGEQFLCAFSHLGKWDLDGDLCLMQLLPYQGSKYSQNLLLVWKLIRGVSMLLGGGCTCQKWGKQAALLRG